MNITCHNPDIRSYQEGLTIKTNNLYGVEIELEDVTFNSLDMNKFSKYWDTKQDDSLRGPNAYELVTKHPFSGRDLEKALEEFSTSIKSAIPSSRCSVHVHVDVRSWEIDHFKSFVLHYLALERVLVKVSGNRENNIFCWPFYRTGVKDILSDVILRSKKCVQFANEFASKYTGLNFIPVKTQGSLEIRIHKGETDKENIIKWLQIISSLVEYTRQEHQHIEDLPEFYSGNGPIEFLNRIFGPLADKLMYDQIGTDLLKGIREVQDILRENKLRHFQLFFPIQRRMLCEEREKSLYSSILKRKESN